MIFDTHAHYDSEEFSEDRDSLLRALPELGVDYVINVGASIKTSANSIAFADFYKYIYAAVGIHPHEAQNDGNFKKEDFIKLIKSSKKVVAVGEIGLDYHYDYSQRDVQMGVFKRQLDIALELNMPVIIHTREADEDTMKVLRDYRPKGEVHCFSGDLDMAKEIISLGMSIGIGGSCTFKNAKKTLEVAAKIPIDYLLLETDAPYMTPSPFRGKRNDSVFIKYTAAKIAEVREVSVDYLLASTKMNAMKLFGISPKIKN